MAWSSLGGGQALPMFLVDKDNVKLADPVVQGGGCMISSTATVVVDDLAGRAFARCYGPRGDSMYSEAQMWSLDHVSSAAYDAWAAYKGTLGLAVGDLTEPTTCAVFSDADSWIEYFDGAPFGSDGLSASAADGVIEVIAVAQTTNDDGSPTAPIQPGKQTCIPYRRSSFSVTTDRILGYGPGGATLVAYTKEVSVAVQNPCVLRVDTTTHHGWLMLTTRAVGPETRFTDGPGERLSDVVAWWSETPEFTEPSGPILLVSSLDAMPGQTAQFRLWLSVPGAAILDSPEGVSSLYIYYVFSAGEPAEDPALPPGSGVGWWDLRGSGLATWRSAVARWRATQGVGDGDHLAVKRIDLQSLLDTIDAGAWSESSWTYTDAVPGELLGDVRVWVSTGEASDTYDVRPFDWYFPVAKRVDPMPLVCDDELTLYFASNLGSRAGTRVGGRFGHGIWRAMALPHRLPLVNLAPSPRATGALELDLEVLSPDRVDPSDLFDPAVDVADWLGRLGPLPSPDGSESAVFGRDFVVRPPSRGIATEPGSDPIMAWLSASPDMVVASSAETVYLDPDVYLLDPETVVLYAGVEGGSAMAAFRATVDEACLRYNDAFTLQIELEAGALETWRVPAAGGRPRRDEVDLRLWPNRLAPDGCAVFAQPAPWARNPRRRDRVGGCGCGGSAAGSSAAMSLG